MAKIVFFILIIFIMLYPIFISNKNYKFISKEKNINKPLIEILDAKFKKYNKILEINGTFKKAYIFKTYYKFNDLFANNLIKKEQYFAKIAIKKGNIIKAKIATYKNSDYLINSKNAIYNEDKKILKGWDFNFTSKKAKGKGSFFKVDNNKNIYAKNIIFYIKVYK